LNGNHFTKGGGDFDLILALALIHHLVITYDLTFEMIAEKFSKICKFLIIEFPLQEDEKVKLISRTKQIQSSKYTIENFKSAFEEYFILVDSQVISCNCRVIFFYKKKSNNN
jgi:hypothetical protein